MSRSVYPAYPPPLTAEQREYLLTTLKDWSIAHGLAVRPAPSFVAQDLDPSGVLATTAPVTLFPSPFPRSCFDEALSIQAAYNELYSAIARDEEWLEQIVKEYVLSILVTCSEALISLIRLIDIDDFISKLWNVHLAVKKDGYAHDLSLGLFRSDYMVHINPEGSEKQLQIKQVEFNTIASSFGGLSWEVAALHKHLLSVDAYPNVESERILTPQALRDSRSVPGLASGLAAAHKSYTSAGGSGSLHDRTDNRKCVLFIVQEPERNVFDQRHLEYMLLVKSGIRSFRVPFDRIQEQTKLSENRTLLYIPPHCPQKPWEVTTVYLRAGYSPDEYKSERHWASRLLLERSRAIKCPSVLTQLAGAKKVQQVLATPGSPHLRRFLCEGEKAAAVQQTFAPIYPVDNTEAGKEAKALATNPETANRYVLKPQREGGGNNVYRKKIPEFLKSLPESHWPAWILMEMIEPPALKNMILRNGEVQEGGVIGELGVYGVCLWTVGDSPEKGRILENKEAGYLLRTKGDTSEEGGVAAGFGAVDSCCLVDI